MAQENHMLIAEYGKEGDFLWRQVIVDPVAGTVTFRRCHLPGRFASWGVEAEYTCNLSELRGVYWFDWRGIGSVMVVVTPNGRARLPQAASNFENVRAALLGSLKPGTALRWYEFPAARAFLALVFIIPSVFLGLVLCIWSLEQSSVLGWLVPGLICGLLSLFFVSLIRSWLRAQPLQ